MIKVGIIGDLHLDKDEPRTSHTLEVLDWALRDGDERGVEQWVFPGDIVEGVPEPVEYLELLRRVFPRRVALGLGNHEDYLALCFLNAFGVRVADTRIITMNLWYPQSLNPPGPAAELMVIPYPRRHRAPFDHLDQYGDDGTIQGSLEAARKKMRDTIRMVLTDATAPVIVVGHFTVEGMKTRDTTFERHRSDEVVMAPSDFEGVALTVVGHIHKAQSVSQSPRIECVGSLVRQDRSEAEDAKGYAIITIEPDRIDYEFIPVPAREMVVVKITDPSEIPALVEVARGKELYVDVEILEDQIHRFSPGDFDVLDNVVAAKHIRRKVIAVERVRAPELAKATDLPAEFSVWAKTTKQPIEEERLPKLNDKLVTLQSEPSSL